MFRLHQCLVGIVVSLVTTLMPAAAAEMHRSGTLDYNSDVTLMDFFACASQASSCPVAAAAKS